MGWQDKIQVKKGNIGEKYVKDFLNKKGFIIYSPCNEGAHKIDYFAHNGKNKNVICVEAKAKRRMAIYPETGFNYDSYLHYIELYEKYNIPTFIYFIDDFEECIYGQWLHILGEGIKRKDVVVWDLGKMKFIRKLEFDELTELRNCSSKVNYDYSKVKKYFTS